MSDYISIIIPVIPSSIALDDRLKELINWTDQNLQLLEIIIVVDGLQEETWEHVKSISYSESKIRAFYLQDRSGLEACTLCGLMSARGDFLVTIDAESKYQTKDISTLLHVLRMSNCNMVYGFSAIISPGVLGNIRYRMSANLFSLFTGLPAYISQFRVMESKVAHNLSVQNSAKFIVDREIHKNKPIYAGVPIKIKTKWFVHRNRGLITRSNLTLSNMIAASNVVEYLGIIMLLINIYLLWQGYIWQSTLLAALAGFILLKMFWLKWRSKESFKIIDSVNISNFAPLN